MIPIKLYLFFFFWFLGFIFLWKIPALKKGKNLNNLSHKLSILIPARNEEKNLGQLLPSLARQTLKPHEIIVIDDHSEDATAEVARKAGCIVMRSKDLPEGWTGKPWACWQGTQKAAIPKCMSISCNVISCPNLRSGLWDARYPGDSVLPGEDRPSYR
jgi:cellulose synthase/poly-beta-1,6-N-acetylglucosamine synthase-like glycosyltransferase